MSDQRPVRNLRLREKLLTYGPKHLSDAELLATFISAGSGKKSCTQLADDLMQQLGDLRAILNADWNAFQQVSGLGVVRYVQLQALREICRRSDYISLQKAIQLTSSQQTYHYLKRQLRDNKNETFAVLFLDSQYRVIAYEELFQGTIDSTTVHLRPLIERILNLNAAALILAHNHPSGLSDPSRQDYEVTDRVRNAIALVDTELLDHVVIGDNEVYSILHTKKWRCN